MRTLACLALLALLPACSLWSWEGDGDGPVDFEDVPGAEYLRVGQPGTAVFNDAEAWAAFWYDHINSFDGEGNPTPPPAIDFGRRTVAAVFAGDGWSGCTNYYPFVRSVTRRHSTASVHVVFPPSLEGSCDALIEPLHVVAFEKARTVRFTGDVPGGRAD